MIKPVSVALAEDREIEQITLKLRDAFRIIGWQYFRPHRKATELSECYTRFYTGWSKHPARTMDYFQLIEYANELEFSVDKLLFIRSNYYGLIDLSYSDQL